MKNITLFRGNKTNGFVKFQVYVNRYKKIVNGKEKEIENIMVDLVKTPLSQVVNGKTVGDFSQKEKNIVLRIGFGSGDIEDIAGFLAFLKGEENTFSTVHESNNQNNQVKKSLTAFTSTTEVKKFVPGKGEIKETKPVKVISLSDGQNKISIQLSLPTTKLIATWIEKHFI